MNKIVCVVAAGFALAGCATSGSSTHSLTIPFGQPRKIDIFTSVHEDCTSVGTIVVRVAKEPSHGKIAIKSSADYPDYRGNNVRKECNKKKVNSEQVWYTPDGQYVGTESFSVLVIFPDNKSRTVSYSLNVM